MELFIEFIGRADPLATLYEGIDATSFLVTDPVSKAQALVVPSIGDRVRVHMHPGPDIREFRCTGRLFDFCGEESPRLHVELDMP